MSGSFIQGKIEESLANGFVDRSRIATEELMPQFIYNGKGDTMLAHVEHGLDKCTSFIFAIAFLTEGALAALKVSFADLAQKGVHGRILTSDYLDFNSPKVFEELLKIPNIDVRIANSRSFHAKGYIFDNSFEDYQSVIIGSSNLTNSALMTNYEWNIKFTSHSNGTVTTEIVNEVEAAWSSASKLDMSWISSYKLKYTLVLPNKERALSLEDTTNSISETTHIKPNAMQIEALSSLEKLRLSGETKGLVISATGTGKTYLAALDVAQFKPKKFLYIVHREQILDKAISSFKLVLKDEPESAFGKLTGSSRDLEAKYIFATVQTISKESWFTQLDSTEFDYILVDEVHRAGVSSYQRIIDYFKPKFL